MRAGACCALLLLAAEARAQDVGEIALIPDVGGMIQQGILLPTRYLGRAACAFYQNHTDRYDAVFVFTTVNLNMLNGVQTGWSTRSAAMGIGRDVYPDTTSQFCATRLRHAVKMGDISSYSDDPDAIYDGIFGFTLSGVELMGHEFGHQWMSNVTFDVGDGQRHCYLRGFNPPEEQPLMPECDFYRNSDFNQHWSYYLNSGSVMYGNTIQDLGGGQFLVSNPAAKYSELDQYLMGLRDPSEVAPMFLVDIGGGLSAGSTAFPIDRAQTEMISGDRLDFTIDDVIRAEGPRVPARDICHWKAAFMIVHEEGSPPTAAEIARVDTYRRRWEEFYVDATDRRGSFDTTLAGTGLGTVECASTEQPEPPLDAGAGFEDAATPPINADASAPIEDDAGEVADAGATTGFEDASTMWPVPMPRDDPGGFTSDEPKTIIDDECSCTTARTARASSATLDLFVFVFALAVLLRQNSPVGSEGRIPTSIFSI